eukprot:gene40540-54815_t
MIGLATLSLFLLAVALLMKKPLDLRQNWKHYLILGFFNSALPFLLYAYAARTLSASVMAVLNATAPIWGAVIGAVWQRQMVSARVMLGLVMGTGGVALLVGFDHASSREGAGLAIAAALFAASGKKSLVLAANAPARAAGRSSRPTAGTRRTRGSACSRSR